MKVPRNLDAMPDPQEVNPLEWKRIARDDKGAFNFMDSHEAWEFPLISPLGRATRVNHWQLDEDADITLPRWGKIWTKDILRQRSALENGSQDEKQLLASALEMEEALNEIGRISQEFSTTLEDQRKWQEEQRKQGNTYFGENAKSPLSLKITLLAEARNNAERAMEKGPLRKLLMNLVRAKYALSLQGRHDFIGEEYAPNSGEEMDREEILYHLGHVTQDVNHAYHFAVVAFPGENLPSYFYDEMLYSESIETASGAESGCLDTLVEAVENGVNDDWFITFLENGGDWRGWWS